MSSRMPVVRQTAWAATIPQFVALALPIGLSWLIMRSPAGMPLGALLYLAYSFGSRAVTARCHRRGIRLLRRARYEEAIRQHEASYDFFARHAWLDRCRSIFLMSPSAFSYREMALVNIAYCHGQFGDGTKAKACYERALREFPDSARAAPALRLIESVQSPPQPVEAEP